MMKRNERKVFILSGAFHTAVVRMFNKFGYLRTINPEEADALVFIGGSDISPHLYGQEPILEVDRPDDERDEIESQVYQSFVYQKPMIGICRGAQLINVLNDGSLWQHVNHHGSTHEALDIKSKRVLRISSMHHQMMRPGKNAEVFLTANVATIFKDHINYIEDSGKIKTKHQDIEGIFYPDTKSLLIQSHPETGPEEHELYFFQQIHDKLGI